MRYGFVSAWVRKETFSVSYTGHPKDVGAPTPSSLSGKV